MLTKLTKRTADPLATLRSAYQTAAQAERRARAEQADERTLEAAGSKTARAREQLTTALAAKAAADLAPAIFEAVAWHVGANDAVLRGQPVELFWRSFLAAHPSPSYEKLRAEGRRLVAEALK